MNTIAFYVNKAGQLVKVVNDFQLICSKRESEQLARDILAGLASNKNRPTLTTTLLNTRGNGLALEQEQEGSRKSIPLADLLPPEYDGSRGTFHITVEFVPNEKKEN
jgi:hypothetical protein